MYSNRLLSFRAACLLVFLLSVGLLSADSLKRLSGSRPNIIVILADDLGFSDLGCYGSEINTPALDRMADEGLRFTQFYNCARCCPTRASLLTGLYPHQAGIGLMGGNLGIPSYQGYLNDRCVTIAEALRDGGYRTLMSGKWHVGGDPAHWPRQRGFDRYFGLIDGASSYWELSEGRRMALDSALYTPEGDDFYMTDAFTDYAVKFIEESNSGDAPFFLYLAYTAPHFPLHAHPADIAKYHGTYSMGWDALRASRHARMKERGIVAQAWPLSPLHEPVPGQRIEEQGPWSRIQNKAEWEVLMEVYAAMIDRMDQGIGRIRAKLEELDMADNTLILFMSDNGACPFDNNETPNIPPGPKGSYHGTGVHWAQASDTPFRWYKQWTHEGGIASPLVAWWPDGITRPGRLDHEPAHVIDIMATCLDVAGVPYPAAYHDKTLTPLEGITLTPVFSGRQRASHEAIFWEHMGSKAVRQGKWKLVAQREIQEWELYDMETDRTELHDLADRHPEKVSEMATLYQAWAKKAGVRPWQDILEMQHSKNKLDHKQSSQPMTDHWQPLPVLLEDGPLADRVELWQQGRLWYMLDAEDGYLLSGFESRPGRQTYQGEHVGKWLHAATLAYEQTHDEKLLKALQQTVSRLLATQEANGYMGTYADQDRFYNAPADDDGWDTWTFRYNLYGLLTYEKFHPDPRVVHACKKMADLLIEVYGEGKHDLTKYGTRQGISATTLLESIVMLYERTREEKYLAFAEHIVTMSENNPKLRLMGAMLEGKSVVYSGDGKAYQLMANLLGYGRLYRVTGEKRYLKAVEHAWKAIRTDHTYVTGGPWSIKMPYNGNQECFALREDFAPDRALVETCSTTTWIQLNLLLLELTGEARYAAETERAFFNALFAAQYPAGIDWCYFTRANQGYQPFQSKITCCASSGPRALEMFARHLIGETDDAISFASLVPCGADLPDAFGKAKIRVTGNYPVGHSVGIDFVQADGRTFALEFREPCGARLTSTRINGDDAQVKKNERGFYRINQGWKTGDTIAITFEYLLESHVELPQDAKRWVAFTYGPWALARVTKKGIPLTQPFLGKYMPSQALSQWLAPCMEKEGDLPAFRIKGSEIVLKPYFSTASLETGPQTYFQF